MLNLTKKTFFGALAILGCSLSITATAETTQNQQTLYVFNYPEYMDPNIIKEFESKYHVKVVESYFQSLGDMYQKLVAGGDSMYDVVISGDYYVPRLIASNLVQPLNKSLIPNLSNILPRFQNPQYDPGNQYSAPYQWSVIGIAYNKKAFPETPDSYHILFDPKINPNQPFAMDNESNVMIASACAYLGLDVSCKDRNSWLKAGKLLSSTVHRANFTGYVAAGTPMIAALNQGTEKVGLTYSGDIAYARSQDPKGYGNLQFFIPKEGSAMSVDSMLITKQAKHPKLAAEFINFILDAKIGAQLSNFNQYLTPNKASLPLVDAQLRTQPLLPSEEQMKRIHFLPNLKGHEITDLQEIWQEVRSN